MERLPQVCAAWPCSCAWILQHALVWKRHHRLPRTSAASSSNLATLRLLCAAGDPRVGLEQVRLPREFCGLRFKARVWLEFDRKPRGGLLHFAMTQGDFRRVRGGLAGER